MTRWGISKPSVADITKGGFSTPCDAPMIPPFPFRFRNAEILTLYWRTDPTAIAFLLPPPLEPMGDVACVHIYKMNDTDWLGPYAEVVVHECWTGPCTVELRPNAQQPVFGLPVIEPLQGFCWRADFTLVAGEIIHDYLEGAR